MRKIIMIIIVLGLSFIGYTYASTPLSGDDQGGIKIEVVNDLGEVVVRDSYDFIEETSLYDILHDNYTVGCASSSYDLDYSCNYESFNSHIVLAIDDVETDWYNSFLEITINGEKSVYGVHYVHCFQEVFKRIAHEILKMTKL